MAEQNVTVYSTLTCPHCTNAKRYLDEKNVEYTNHDVGTDMEKRKEMVEKSGQMGVPVIDIDGEIIVGFDRPRIDGLLGL